MAHRTAFSKAPDQAAQMRLQRRARAEAPWSIQPPANGEGATARVMGRLGETPQGRGAEEQRWGPTLEMVGPELTRMYIQCVGLVETVVHVQCGHRWIRRWTSSVRTCEYSGARPLWTQVDTAVNVQCGYMWIPWWTHLKSCQHSGVEVESQPGLFSAALGLALATGVPAFSQRREAEHGV